MPNPKRYLYCIVGIVHGTAPLERNAVKGPCSKQVGATDGVMRSTASNMGVNGKNCGDGGGSDGMEGRDMG